jgi:2-amino-4-hydroxy-6-hydroxymethyldihydropteridine diphosphokinase
MTAASARSSRFDESVYIGLGSNLGDRNAHLADAMHYLRNSSNIRVVATSAFLETLPWGHTDQPDFLNGVTEIRTDFSPAELLKFLKEGEQILGRTPTERWGPRVIDLDILLFGNRIIKDTDLVIPHPEMTRRRFVLDPLLELNPHGVHPISGRKLREFTVAGD